MKRVGWMRDNQRNAMMVLLATSLAWLSACSDDDKNVQTSEEDTYEVCAESQVKTESCGQNEEGVQRFVCEGDAWVKDGQCVDPDQCENGDVRTTECGINGAGTQAQTCQDGQWKNDGACDDVDQCKNDAEHLVSCGRNGNGVQKMQCVDGEWTNVDACQDNPDDVCVNGDTWSKLCGPNDRGQQALICENGAWVNDGECQSDEQCVDGDTQDVACGVNGAGIVIQECLLGEWVDQNTCDDSARGPEVHAPTIRVTNAVDDETNPTGRELWNLSALNSENPPTVKYVDLHRLVVQDHEGNNVRLDVQEDGDDMIATFIDVEDEHGTTGSVRQGWYHWSITDEDDNLIAASHIEIRSDQEEDKSFRLSGLTLELQEVGELTMLDERGDEVPAASVREYDEKKRYDFITINDVIYSYEAIATREETIPTRGRVYSPVKLSDRVNFYDRVPMTVRVPKDANFEVFRKVAVNPVSPEHYIEFLPIDAQVDEEHSDADYDAYTIDAPSNVLFHIEASIPGETVKYAEMFKITETPSDIKEITLEAIDENTMTGDNGYKEADILTNVEDDHVVSLGVSETFDLDIFRVWQAMKGDSSNYFVDPNYLIEIYGDAANVTPQHTPGRAQATIEANEPGVSVITLGYEPIHVFDTFSFVMWGNEPPPPGQNADDDFFNAIEPARLGVVIVQVGEENVDEIDMGIDLTVFDTLYFERSQGHFAYTFEPTANEALEICVHTPLHVAEWDSDWNCYEPNSDDSYTVELTEGRNIVRAQTDNSTQFYVLRAMPVDIAVENASDADAPITVGDDIIVRIDGLSTPVPKLSNVYNPNFPSNGWVQYALDDETITGSKTQYAIANHGLIELEGFDAAGEYTLTNGQIHTLVGGQAPGAHRGISRGGSKGGYTGGDPTIGPLYGALPDIVIEVTD